MFTSQHGGNIREAAALTGLNADSNLLILVPISIRSGCLTR